mmetsp:Transcript_22743/g.52411  ORF Transcript_22743/g.52411 Transcript_22743/m.52411 type:complete len:97 (+) Transcript_22743:107-397(+)
MVAASMKLIMPMLLKWKVEGVVARYTLKPIQKNEVQNHTQYVKLSKEMTKRPHHFISFGNTTKPRQALHILVKSHKTTKHKKHVPIHTMNCSVMSS